MSEKSKPDTSTMKYYDELKIENDELRTSNEETQLKLNAARERINILQVN